VFNTAAEVARLFFSTLKVGNEADSKTEIPERLALSNMQRSYAVMLAEMALSRKIMWPRIVISEFWRFWMLVFWFG
jgi:hypothetical protein